MPGKWLQRTLSAAHPRCVLCPTVPLAGLMVSLATASEASSHENVFLSDAAMAGFQEELDRAREEPACLEEIRGYLAGTPYHLAEEGDPPAGAASAAEAASGTEPDSAPADDARAIQLDRMVTLTNCLTANFGTLSDVDAGGDAETPRDSIVVTVIRAGDTPAPAPFSGGTTSGGSTYMCTGLWRGGAMVDLAQSGIQGGCPKSTLEDIIPSLYTPPAVSDPRFFGFGAQPVDHLAAWREHFTSRQIQIPQTYGPVDIQAHFERALKEADSPYAGLLEGMEITVSRSGDAPGCSCPGMGK